MSDLRPHTALGTPKLDGASVLTRAGWLLLALSATAVGLISLRYALPKIPLPSDLPNFETRRPWLVTHAVASSVALLLGPWQFVALIRRRWHKTHRWMGRIYCVSVLAGWISSLPIAAHAAFGPVSSAGFLLLGVAWIATTTLGYITGVQGRWSVHREWMIRSYALTAAAITLRLYLLFLLVAGVPFPVTYRIVAWACWVFNLMFAEWRIRRTRAGISGIYADAASSAT